MTQQQPTRDAIDDIERIFGQPSKFDPARQQVTPAPRATPVRTTPRAYRRASRPSTVVTCRMTECTHLDAHDRTRMVVTAKAQRDAT